MRASRAKFLFVVLAVAVGVGSLTGVRGFSRSFRHMLLREARTLMAGDMTIQIDFAVTDEQAEQLLLSLRDESIDLFYMRIPIEYGVIAATD